MYVYICGIISLQRIQKKNRCSRYIVVAMVIKYMRQSVKLGSFENEYFFNTKRLLLDVYNVYLLLALECIASSF